MTSNDQPGRGLKICHLGKFYPPATGGVETHVQTLARAQVALGADVRVICVNHEGAGGSDVTWRTAASTATVEQVDEGVRVTRLGRRASVSRFDVCPSLLTTLLRARREGVDIAHVHAPNPTMFAALAVLPKFKTLVVTHHSDVIKQRVLGAAFAPIERLIHARAAMVLSDSENYIGGSAPLKRIMHKVRTLPLGLDLRPFLSPNAAALSYAEKLRAEFGAPLWLTVGRLVYYKGFCNAVDALANTPGRLVVVGEGPLKQKLVAQAKSRGVSHRIFWAGYLDEDELAGAYRAATALLFPSNARSEGFGLAQVEAMASGCPVINTQIPHSGVAWVSPHDETGATVPVDDPAALAQAMRRLNDDSELRARFSSASVARAMEEFDHRVMARRSFALYDEATRCNVTRLSDAGSARGTSPNEYSAKSALR